MSVTRQAPDAPPAPISPLGDRALIVDLPDLDTVLAARERLQATRPEGVDDIVPAARTLAVLIDPRRASLDAVRAWVERNLSALGTSQLTAPRTHVRDEPSVVVDVVYDGDDLREAAEALGLDPDELVRRHTAATWRVAFNGFTPGFGYLVTDDDWPQVPRRSSPRTNVPEGSVALAGGFSGVYPRQGPGGWQLIGRTDAPLWRPHSSRPALLTPGTVVRFRDAGTLRRTSHDAPDATTDAGAAHRAIPGAGEAELPDPSTAPTTAAEPAPLTANIAMPVLTVVRAGPQLLVEDLGRPGWASVGAGRSGALDRAALRLANRLVGNDEGAAGLEVVVECELRFEQPAWFAVTGARGALRLGGHPIEPDAAVHAAVGDTLSLGVARRGLRYVVAVRGGIDADAALGSRATDIGARVGPEPLADGDPLWLAGRVAGDIPAVDALTVWPPVDDEVDVHVVPGPRADWFAPASVAAFYDVDWEVTQQSNRVGMRLRSPQGASIERSSKSNLPSELPSEPMVPGAIQVPPSGEPTVLLADGPVTGGYPVIAVVADADLDLFAQLRPGQRIRFRHARTH